MDKIVLVTGGAGFVGSNFIKHLIGNYPDYRIINFDLLSFGGNLSNLTEVNENPNYIFVRGNVANTEDVKNVFEQFSPEVVVHLAAETSIERSFLEPNVMLKTNVLGTQNVINCAIKYNVKKMIYSSTGMVYGCNAQADDKFSEKSNFHPVNFYAAGKASSDILLKTAFQSHNLPVNIIRSCRNYGAFQSPGRLIPYIIQRAIENQEIPILEDSSVFNTWVHVKDHCRAIDLVLHNAESGEDFNVGTSNIYSNMDLAKFILNKMNKSERLLIPIKDRIGNENGCILNTEKIGNYLGWKPIIDFESGIEDTIDWYINHQKWVDETINDDFNKSYKEIYKGSM